MALVLVILFCPDIFYMLVSHLPGKAKGDYSLDSVRHIKLLSCPDFCLDILWYIDLIIGMWLYLDELQFKFEFISGRMIFSWVMALELVFFVQILSCPNFFDVFWDIDLIFGMWLYLDELPFKFEFRSGRMIFGWVMALELVF